MSCLQNLATELQQVRLEKQSVEAHFVELQHARDSDLHQFQLQLSALEEELRLSQEAQKESSVTIETNQELALELEKEKGRLAGRCINWNYNNTLQCFFHITLGMVPVPAELGKLA